MPPRTCARSRRSRRAPACCSCGKAGCATRCCPAPRAANVSASVSITPDAPSGGDGKLVAALALGAVEREVGGLECVLESGAAKRRDPAADRDMDERRGGKQRRSRDFGAKPFADEHRLLDR